MCEDDPTARRVIAGVLQQRGLEVIAELDMIPPLTEVVQYGRPDVVVLDLVLSGMAGPDALIDLEAIAGVVPVVVFSAFDSLRDDALNRGAQAFVDKPNFEELADAVATAAERGPTTTSR